MEEHDIASEPLLDGTNQDDNNDEFETPKLAEGKKYHLFISYSNKDYDMVKELLLKLETAYNIRCAFGERDFIAGKTTQQNINDTMQESMKILICLTPNYLESGWCDYEHEIAIVLSMERKNCIIPLMLTPCEIIPNSLKTLTYINAEVEPDVPGKIIEALYFNASPNCWIPNVIPRNYFVYSQTNPLQEVDPETLRKQNGMKLLFVDAVKDVPSCTFGNVFKFRPLTRKQKDQLHKDNVKLAILLYKKIYPVLNETSLLQHFGVCYHSPQAILMCLLSLIIPICLTVAGTLLYIILSKSFEISLSGIIISILLSLIVAPTGTICKVVLKRREMVTNFHQILWDLQRKYYKQCEVLMLYNEDNTRVPCLEIIRYDTKPCKEFIQRLLQRKHPRLSEDEIVTQSEEQIELCIRRHHLNLLSWWKLPDYKDNRHNTFMKKQCLCQILEEEISLQTILENRESVEV